MSTIPTTLSYSCGSSIEKNAYKISAATITAVTTPAPRLTFRTACAFHFVFAPSSGPSRVSTNRTIGFSRNANTAPRISGSKIASNPRSTPKNPGRSVKITTSTTLMQITPSAVSPHFQ